MSNRTILVVDDEPGIVTVVRDYLDAAGFRVLLAGDGRTALRLARNEHPGLIVLDLMLPGIGDLDLIHILRQDPSTSTLPIIMLTARADDGDRMIGDDYITKPFRPRELVARVRAVLRRSEGYGYYSSRIEVGALAIDLEERLVRRESTMVDLTATEFDILRVLATAPGRAFTRAQLVDQVYGESYDGAERTVDAHIKNLRRKIEADPRHPQYILMVYGVGYKFVEQLEEV